MFLTAYMDSTHLNTMAHPTDMVFLMINNCTLLSTSKGYICPLCICTWPALEGQSAYQFADDIFNMFEKATNNMACCI